MSVGAGWISYAARAATYAENLAAPDRWITADRASEMPSTVDETPGFAKWRQRIDAAIEQQQCDIRLFGTSSWPQRLSNPSTAPAVLFVRGNFSAEPDRSIAIVGSRRASAEARSAAFRIGRSLDACGITVISGLAAGVDTRAHEGALAGNGRTVAVIGTGIDRAYPPQNAELAERIVGTGAVVTQFPPGQSGSKTTFPARNAIIAALSSASLAIDADERSGTRIELDCALAAGRPVLLWAPLMGQYEWAQRFVDTTSAAHFVKSVEEIQQFT